jgi:hypothetical protein
VINGIGAVHALFPILENASKSDEGPDLSFLSPSVEKECRLIEGHEGSVDSDEWEILPSSSYSGTFSHANKLYPDLAILHYEGIMFCFMIWLGVLSVMGILLINKGSYLA